MVECTNLAQSESGEEHIPVLLLGVLLKSHWKAEMNVEDPFLYHCIHLMIVWIWMPSYMLKQIDL